jgi:putative membrane-bound dehydrogenase-like protein
MRLTRLWMLTLGLVAFPLDPAHAQREFGFDNTKPSGQPYLKPEESVARMKVAEGFEVKLFAAEPQVVNPIAMTVDEKGRVWVVECFEYPKRTAKGKMPRDRIKILEDTDGDGVCDKVTVFMEGKDFPVPFDLASGIEVGYGGVFLGAPPYLFFIENKDDKPGKVEILLKGFGSQDTHEMLNTFQWGPDGRLYGLHGVFTNSEVKPDGEPEASAPGLRLNAGVWRFDVKAKKFEVFAEGTSNPWGMDWRNTDGQFILCCCVIPHLYHIVPGGIYRRQAGTSFNPYAYGEIKEICDHTFHRESGWAHAGLISLDTPLMPEKYRNSVIFGSIHGCSIKQNILKPNGSSFTASRGDDFLVSGDKNFRPINLRWGPNGEIYCIDWHDQNPCHQAKPDSWDYEHGRVYRIQPKGLPTKKAEDFSRRTTAELLKLIDDPNPYRYRTALRLLGERAEAEGVPQEIKEQLDEQFRGKHSKFEPRHLWAVSAMRAAIANKPAALVRMLYPGIELIRRPFPEATSAWFARLLDDAPGVTTDQLQALAAFARSEPSCIVRRELAGAMISLRSARQTLPVIHALMQRKEDVRDPIIPQLLWLAYESRLTAAAGNELEWLKANASGNPLITEQIVPRAMRRLVATGKPEDLAACVGFVRDAKDSAVRRQALEGLATALQNKQIDPPANWKELRDDLVKENTPAVQALVLRLSVSFRDPEAIRRALAIAVDGSKPAHERLEAVRSLALAHPPEALTPLLKLMRGEQSMELRAEATRALGALDRPEVARELLADWEKYPSPLKSEVVQALAGRNEWARELLNAVAAKRVQRTDLTDNTILRIQAFKDKQLDQQIEKVWGRVRPTPAELNALIDKMRGELAKGRASFARGKVVFDNQCAKCHKFDGRGFEVGPSIEGAGRDVEYLLVNVLDPNRVIGAPYFMRTLNLADGSVVTGVLAAEDEQTVTIKSENAVLKVIPRKDIEAMRVQEKSLMPEGLANNMSVQDFRDLIRYVMANPFLTDVQVTVKDKNGTRVSTPLVPPSGIIRLPDLAEEGECEVSSKIEAPADTKAPLLVSIDRDFEVRLNGSEGPAAKGYRRKGTSPDHSAVPIELKKGANHIVIGFRYSGRGETISARFADPDRKLAYPDWIAEK